MGTISARTLPCRQSLTITVPPTPIRQELHALERYAAILREEGRRSRHLRRDTRSTLWKVRTACCDNDAPLGGRWALLLAPACGWISNHALTVGFDGSAYHGWQADPTVSTVEGELQRAIRAAGLATWTTRVRAKHQGSESSRTDAKVHAARLVACVPLNQHAPRASDELCALLNAHLPPTSGFGPSSGSPESLPQRFDARAHCSHREYEYLVPASFIESLAREGSSAGDDVHSRLRATCSLFEGAREWHNFAHVPRASRRRSARRGVRSTRAVHTRPHSPRRR